MPGYFAIACMTAFEHLFKIDLFHTHQSPSGFDASVMNLYIAYSS